MKYNFGLDYDASSMCSTVPVQLHPRSDVHEASHSQLTVNPPLTAVNAISVLASKINITSPITVTSQSFVNYDVKEADTTLTSLGQYYFPSSNFINGYNNFNAGNLTLPSPSSSSFIHDGSMDNMGSSAFMYNHNYQQMHYHYHHHQHDVSNVPLFAHSNSTNYNGWPPTVDFYDELARLGTVGFSSQINSTNQSTNSISASQIAEQSQIANSSGSGTNNIANNKRNENGAISSIISNQSCWTPLSPIMMTAMPFSTNTSGIREDFTFNTNYSCPKLLTQTEYPISRENYNEKSNVNVDNSALNDEINNVNAYDITRNNKNSDVEDVTVDEEIIDREYGRSHGFPCTVCDRKYCRKSTLRTHMKHHIGQRPFVCQICGKSFSQSANLTAHRRVHTGEKPFKCYICFRPFSQSSSLVTHKRTHTGERPYPCNQCDKAFTDSSTLTKHLRTHTGHKPYTCQLCMMQFSQSGNLHRHMKTHSINTT